MNADDFIDRFLRGKLWHTTTTTLFDLITADGHIRPDPKIPRHLFYSKGKNVSFARLSGGFSIFDFPSDFDIPQYRDRCRLSSIEQFIPVRSDFSEAVWIELDVTKCGDKIVRGDAALALWKAKDAYRHRIMPYIEGFHFGPMPIDYIAGAYLYRRGYPDWRRL